MAAPLACNMDAGFAWTVIVASILAVVLLGFGSASEFRRIYRGGSGAVDRTARIAFAVGGAMVVVTILAAWIGSLVKTVDDAEADAE